MKAVHRSGLAAKREKENLYQREKRIIVIVETPRSPAAEEVWGGVERIEREGGDIIEVDGGADDGSRR